MNVTFGLAYHDTEHVEGIIRMLIATRSYCLVYYCSALEISKEKITSTMLYLQQTYSKEIHPYRSTSFLKG